MKLQRWALYRGSLEATTNGPWVLATDIEALEKRVQELEYVVEHLTKENARIRDKVLNACSQLKWLFDVMEKK